MPQRLPLALVNNIHIDKHTNRDNKVGHIFFFLR